MKSWYQIKAASDDEFEVVIYDEIGFWGITARQFIEDFKKIPDAANVKLRINSPGGDVFDSIAIYNVIKRHEGPVNGTVDGIAASGASIIAMAADSLSMPKNTFLMVHNASGLVWGNKEDMREWADVMEKIDNALVSTYVARTGQTPEKITELLTEETWLTAEEAKDLGFADEVTDAVRLAARGDLKRFKNAPKGLKGKVSGVRFQSSEETDPAPAPVEDPPADPAPQTMPIPETDPPPADTITSTITLTPLPDPRAEALAILTLCQDAGVQDLASEFLAKGMSADQVKERLKDAQAIHDACAAAKLPERAANYIKAGMALEEVRANLLAIKAATEGPEIDGKLGPKGERQDAKKEQVIDYNAIYANYTGKKKK